MTTRARLTVVLATAPVLAFIVVGGLLARASVREEVYPHLRVFDDVFGLTTNSYVEPVDADRLMHGAMHGLAEALDADSAFLTRDETKLAGTGAAMAAGDVGIELTRQYYLRVIAVRDGSPAARAGVRGGDFIRIIGRKPTRDMSVYEGTRLLRGAPGTAVSLTLLRGNATEPHIVDLVRETAEPPPPAARLAAPGVGLVRIAAFNAATPAALRGAAAQLQREGAKALILDVRENAFGALTAGIDAARVFVPSGPLAVLEARDSARETVTAAAGDGAVTLPLAVLVDSGTAGAAELFAAALAGSNRGELIGERTAGRTAVQRMFPLPDGSALWMSYAHYLTTAGEPIHERGLPPAVAVPQPDVDFGSAPPPGDATIDKALERLRARSAAPAPAA